MSNKPYQPLPRWQEKLFGMLAVLVGGWCWWFGWYTSLYQGYYFKASIIAPLMVVLGIGLLMFPGYREERIARREDISKLSDWQQLTPRWWVILIISVIAVIANWIALTSPLVLLRLLVWLRK